MSSWGAWIEPHRLEQIGGLIGTVRNIAIALALGAIVGAVVLTGLRSPAG